MKIISKNKNKGVSLVELMVGVAIGLLTVAVAIGALMSAKTVTGSAHDSTFIQQQASFIFQNIGQQLRQTGSLRLNIGADANSNKNESFLIPVVFEKNTATFNYDDNVIGVIDTTQANSSLFIGYQDYAVLHHTPFNGNIPTSILRDCLGQNSDSDFIQSNYTFKNNELRCDGNQRNNPQPLARNIAEFRIRYITQSFSFGTTQIQSIDPSDLGGAWSTIRGIEVCAVIFGNEIVTPDDNATYQGCNGPIRYDSLGGSQRNKVHKKYSSTYQLRSATLTTSP